MTDMIANAGWNVKLVGFLGGDKLSVESEPHLPPGELAAWGPLDEFLIVNARRPVDFYVPGQDEKPRDLPGCTGWEKESYDKDGSFCFTFDAEMRRWRRADLSEAEKQTGLRWACKALKVPGQPRICFLASEKSASNGVSSTKIRELMALTPDCDLHAKLKDQVLCPDLLVQFLEKYRGKRMWDENDDVPVELYSDETPS